MSDETETRPQAVRPPISLIDLLQHAEGKCWITGRNPGWGVLAIRITEDDRLGLMPLRPSITCVEAIKYINWWCQPRYHKMTVDADREQS